MLRRETADRLVSPDLSMQIRAGRIAYEPVVPPRGRRSPLPLATQRLLLTAWLVVTDVVGLATAFRLAYWIRFDLQITVAPEVVGNLASYDTLAALLIPVWVAAFFAFDLYEPSAKLGGIHESSRAFHASTTAAMIVIAATFFGPTLVVSRLWLVAVWVLSFLLVAANRFAQRRLVYALRARGYLLSPAVIVGSNEEAESLAAFLGDWRASGVELRGFVATAAPGGRTAPKLGRVDEIADVVTRHGIEDVIVAITSLSRSQLLRLCEDVDRLPVRLRLSSGLYELLTTRVEVRTLGTVPLMSVEKNRLDRIEGAVKRLLDLGVATLALVALAPVLCAVALIVKLGSPGPVFHRRGVLGASGCRFDALKFRTMYVDGDARLAARPGAAEALRRAHKLKDDPRITPAGRWLRRFSVDELPQLLNVVAGQMSLVGPRMITPSEADEYGAHRMSLLTVKPGITGLWQVSGRSDLSYDERVRIDMYYVRNYSVWMDLQILFVQTLPAVLRGRGAY